MQFHSHILCSASWEKFYVTEGARFFVKMVSPPVLLHFIATHYIVSCWNLLSMEFSYNLMVRTGARDTCQVYCFLHLELYPPPPPPFTDLLQAVILAHIRGWITGLQFRSLGKLNDYPVGAWRTSPDN